MRENAAIDDGYSHACSVQPILLPRNVSLDCRDNVIGSHFGRTVRANVSNVRVELQPCQQFHRYSVSCPIDLLQRKLSLCAPFRQVSKMLCFRSLVELNDDAYRAVSIQRKIGQVGGYFAVTAGSVAIIGPSLGTSRHRRKDEDRYHSHKEEPKPA